MGEIVSVALTWGVSKLTRPLPGAHLERLFGAPVRKRGTAAEHGEQGT